MVRVWVSRVRARGRTSADDLMAATTRPGIRRVCDLFTLSLPLPLKLPLTLGLPLPLTLTLTLTLPLPLTIDYRYP